MEVSSQFEQVFKVFDANGDGKISALELTEVLLCLGYEKSTADDEAKAMMREVDSNGDGFIDLNEFMVAMNPVNGNSVNGNGNEYDHLMDAFMIFDADKNGLISAGELRRVLLSLGSKNCSISECKKMIKGVDRDGDGFVDFEEFRSMMRARK